MSSSHLADSADRLSPACLRPRSSRLSGLGSGRASHRPTLSLSRQALRLLVLCALLLVGCTPRYVTFTKQGDVLYRKQELDAARKKYDAALKSNPKYAPALVKLGQMALIEEDWDQARQAFTATVAADPMMGEAFRGRGIAYLHQAQIEPAGEDFRKAKELGAARADLWLGIYNYLAGKYEPAFISLKDELRAQGDTERAALYLFKTGLASGDPKSARELMARAPVPSDPVSAARYHRMTAELAYLDGDYPAALEALAQVKENLSFGIWYREPSPSFRRKLGSQSGAVVELVNLGGPAATAGILPADVVVSFDRKPIRSARELDGAIKAYRAKANHDEALIEVLRGDQQLAFRVMPDQFKTRALIEKAASGGERVGLTEAPAKLMDYP